MRSPKQEAEKLIKDFLNYNYFTTDYEEAICVAKFTAERIAKSHSYENERHHKWFWTEVYREVEKIDKNYEPVIE